MCLVLIITGVSLRIIKERRVDVTEDTRVVHASLGCDRVTAINYSFIAREDREMHVVDEGHWSLCGSPGKAI